MQQCHSAEVTKILGSNCNQKSGAAAPNTFSNAESNRKVTVSYFIVRSSDILTFFLCCFPTVHFKDWVSRQ